MNPAKSRSVYRYFELADAFVQIQVCDPAAAGIAVRPGLNRASYRRLVVETCMPELGDVRAEAARLHPDDPLLAEDRLYELCIEVNPAFDIHAVRLPGMPAPAAASHDHGAGLAVRSGERSRPEEFHLRLRRRARDLERRLLRKIVGQDRAVASVVRAVDRASAGLAAPGRPLATFLLLGRTGTGKTELGRTLAAELYADGAQKGLVRIDCSEFALAHEYSKLIGSPPGYIGHEDGGQLTEALIKNPESIVLFDEIEKAHPRMHNLLLSILEEGALTDGKGRRASFERALVLMTSNAGAGEMIAARRALGFGAKPVLGSERLHAIAFEALERQFSPEFLGRIDETVVFAELDLDAARAIAQRQLSELALRIRRRGVRVAFTPAVARWVARRGFSLEYGARELRRVVQRDVEAPLAQILIEDRLARGTLLRARIADDRPEFEVED